MLNYKANLVIIYGMHNYAVIYHFYSKKYTDVMASNWHLHCYCNYYISLLYIRSTWNQSLCIQEANLLSMVLQTVMKQINSQPVTCVHMCLYRIAGKFGEFGKWTTFRQTKICQNFSSSINLFSYRQTRQTFSHQNHITVNLPKFPPAKLSCYMVKLLIHYNKKCIKV